MSSSRNPTDAHDALPRRADDGDGRRSGKRRAQFMRTRLFATALTFAVLPLITPALAAERPDRGPSLDVTYSDLNLTNPAGAEAMLRRIKHAASKVCGGTPSPRTLVEMRHYRMCVRAAVEDAVRRLNAPLVTALLNGASGAGPNFAERSAERQ
jgi:UrcA family protein